MAFVLPSFGAASNYAASFQPVQPLIMPDNVKSTAFAEALKEANQLEYAAAAQLGKAALDEKGAIIRRQLAEEGALERAELAREPKPMSKADKLVALAQLGSGLAPGGKAQQGDPLGTQLGIANVQNSLNTLRHGRLAGSKDIREAIEKLLPQPQKYDVSKSFDLEQLAPKPITLESQPVASTLDMKDAGEDAARQILVQGLKLGLIKPEDIPKN